MRHFEQAAHVAAVPQIVFERLDDHTRLGEHMGKSSAMMGGGKMTYEFDEGGGRAVGSHIRMGGEAFGLKLFVDEVVTERSPPRRKVWRTVGAPRLVIIDAYEMGFEVDPDDDGSRLKVWIDYSLPEGLLGALFGPPLGRMYARWCVQRMVADAQAHFQVAAQAQVRSPVRKVADPGASSAARQ